MARELANTEARVRVRATGCLTCEPVSVCSAATGVWLGNSTHDCDRRGVGYALMTVAICRMRLAQPQDGHEGLVNAPLLFRVHPAYQITEPPSVNGADLFD